MIKFFVTLNLLLVSLPLMAGVSVGNGADGLTPSRNGWFQNPEREVTVCFETSASVIRYASSFEELFHKAWKKWTDYTNKIDPLNSKGLQMRFANRIRLSLACDYLYAYDLRIYIGTEDNLVKKLKTRYVNPTAFSEKTENTVKRWNPGIIWIKDFPPYLSTESFRTKMFALLLHELGHVFGVPHIPNTIMDLHIDGKLSQWSSVDEIQIDQKNLVYSPSDFRPVSKKVTPGTKEYLPLATAFHQLTQKKPKGDIAVKMQRSRNEPNLALFLSDDRESYLFELKSTGKIGAIEGPEIFFIANTLRTQVFFTGEIRSYLLKDPSSKRTFVFYHSYNHGPQIHKLVMTDFNQEKQLVLYSK